MRRLTGSGLDVAAACPGAFALPVVVEEPGEAADRGTIIHEYLRTGQITSQEYQEDCLEIDYRKAVPFAEELDVREACYAFLPSGDVEFMGYDLGRDYSQAPPNSIPITVDRAFLDSDNLWVVDYKTGMEAPPATSLQLALGAYCVAKTFGSEAVKVAIIHLPPGRREPIWLVHEYDDLDLELIAHQVRNIIAAVSNARQKEVPDVHTGAHCKWCPAKRACPSTSALAQYVVAGMPDGIAITVASMTVGQVGEAWDKLTQAKSFVDELERELKRRVALEGEVPLPDGGTVAVGERTYKSVDPEPGQKVFEQLGIDPEPKVRYENGVVEAAAKAAGIKPAKLWKALAEGGALKIRTQETIQRKKAKE